MDRVRDVVQVSSKQLLKSSLQKKPWLPPVRLAGVLGEDADELGAAMVAIAK